MSGARSSRVATVLYEDQSGQSLKDFYPHLFVLALVAEQSQKSVHDLRTRIDGVPKKGVNKLIADCARTERIAERGRLFVLVDRDRIAEHLHLRNSASDDEVVEALRDCSDRPEQLFVAFLRPNMEGLLESIATCGGRALPARKSINERDLVLKDAAFKRSTAVRDCVRQKQPSLGALVDELAKLVAAS